MNEDAWPGPFEVLFAESFEGSRGLRGSSQLGCAVWHFGFRDLAISGGFEQAGSCSLCPRRQDVFVYIICQEAAELPKVRLVTGLSVMETGVRVKTGSGLHSFYVEYL